VTATATATSIPPNDVFLAYFPIVCNGDYGVACFGWPENTVSTATEPIK
jgi:hypothetical protein